MAVACELNASKDGSNVNAAVELISMEGNARDRSHLIRIPAADGRSFLLDHDHALAGAQFDRSRQKI